MSAADLIAFAAKIRAEATAALARLDTIGLDSKLCSLPKEARGFEFPSPLVHLPTDGQRKRTVNCDSARPVQTASGIGEVALRGMTP